MKKTTLIINSLETEMRIDRVLTKRIPSLSRTKIKTMIEQGDIEKKNGKPIKPNGKYPQGTEISVTLLEEQPFELYGEDIPLDIIFEDNHFFAVNKPAGLVIYPGVGNPSGTLVNALLGSGKILSDDPNGVKPGIVHRLDKQTSGLILIAKTNHIHAKFTSIFAKRKIKKEYTALVWGNPTWDEINTEKPIARDPKNRKRFIVSDEGRVSSTKFVVTEKLGHLTVLQAFPKTGRTHQIRVHLNNLHHSIFGDETYNGGKKHCNGFIKPVSDYYRKMIMINKIGLHATKLEFQHPITTESIELSLPLPDYFKNWIECARKIYCG